MLDSLTNDTERLELEFIAVHERDGILGFDLRGVRGRLEILGSASNFGFTDLTKLE